MGSSEPCCDIKICPPKQEVLYAPAANFSFLWSHAPLDSARSPSNDYTVLFSPIQRRGGGSSIDCRRVSLLLSHVSSTSNMIDLSDLKLSRQC